MSKHTHTKTKRNETTKTILKKIPLTVVVVVVVVVVEAVVIIMIVIKTIIIIINTFS